MRMTYHLVILTTLAGSVGTLGARACSTHDGPLPAGSVAVQPVPRHSHVVNPELDRRLQAATKVRHDLPRWRPGLQAPRPPVAPEAPVHPVVELAAEFRNLSGPDLQRARDQAFDEVTRSEALLVGLPAEHQQAFVTLMRERRDRHTQIARRAETFDIAPDDLERAAAQIERDVMEKRRGLFARAGVADPAPNQGFAINQAGAALDADGPPSSGSR